MTDQEKQKATLSQKSKKGVRKSVSKNRRDYYEYQELNKIEVSQQKVHFYGVIVDSQIPHKSYKSDKYVCSLKITDKSCQIDKETGHIQYFNLVLFAKRQEDLPNCQKIGDIIRIHRAQVGIFKSQKQFTANIFFNSSWAVFSHQIVKKQLKEKEFLPYIFFGKNITFENYEKQILRQLRQWIKKGFEQYRMISNEYITELKQLKNIQKDDKQFDFDLQVRVLQTVKLDNYTCEMRVIDDSHEIWHAQYQAYKYRFLKEGYVIRIRQATLQNHKSYERVFGLKPSSNILRLPYDCLIAKEMNLQIAQDLNKKFEKQMLTEQLDCQSGFNNYLNHPIIITELQSNIDDDGNYLDFNSLKELIDYKHQEQQADKASEAKEQNLFKCRFSVQQIIPDPFEEQKSFKFENYLKVYNTQTGDVRDAVKTDKSDKLSKQKEKLFIFVQLICQDPSLLSSGEYLRLNIVQEQSKDSKGFFSGIQPEDLLGSGKKNEEAQSRFLACLKTILRFNVHVDALIRIKQIDLTNEKAKKSKALNSHDKVFVIEEGKTKLKDFSS